MMMFDLTPEGHWWDHDLQHDGWRLISAATHCARAWITDEFLRDCAVPNVILQELIGWKDKLSGSLTQMIAPDYISQLSPEERYAVNKALGCALTYGQGIVTYSSAGFNCDEEVAKWFKRIDG